jgi:hypothetical protein
VLGAADEAGTLGAADGAADGTTVGSGVGEDVQAARAPNMASDRVIVAIARFIWNLEAATGQLDWPSDQRIQPASGR